MLKELVSLTTGHQVARDVASLAAAVIQQHTALASALSALNPVLPELKQVVADTLGHRPVPASAIPHLLVSQPTQATATNCHNQLPQPTILGIRFWGSGCCSSQRLWCVVSRVILQEGRIPGDAALVSTLRALGGTLQAGLHATLEPVLPHLQSMQEVGKAQHHHRGGQGKSHQSH